MEYTEGQSIDGTDDHWNVSCPKCDEEFEYKGFFDSDDITKCKCGCEFKTNRVWINDSHYIIGRIRPTVRERKENTK